jgi:hypothetical protein
MSIPFALPDWMPGWLPFVVLIPVLLYGLTFIAIPFAVFGVKGRLDLLEARLDEIQGEIRLLSLRLPEVSRADGSEAASLRAGASRPPIPPAFNAARLRDAAPQSDRSALPGDNAGGRRWGPEEEDPAQGTDRPASRRRTAERPDRAEPRLDWPR